MFEQISFFDGKQKFKINKPIRLIELFGGIGSQAKALENLHANFEHYKLCEFDQNAVNSYNAIHNTCFQTSDITKIKASDLEIVNTDKYCYIMTYSFPCQDLSLAGLRKGMGKDSGTRSGLLWEVERILDECVELPQVLVMENVPEVIGSKNIQHFSKWLAKLDSLGYKSKYKILNAKDYGIPQSRRRCFMVSVLGDYYYEFPEKQEPTLLFRDLLEFNVDRKYYLSQEKLYKISLWHAQQKPLKDIDLEKEYCPCITARGAGEEHSGMIVIDEDIYKKPRLNNQKKGPHPTAFGNNIRYLTPKECFRLMGFSDQDYAKTKTIANDTLLYKQTGNSIVVNVLMAIFSQML